MHALSYLDLIDGPTAESASTGTVDPRLALPIYAVRRPRSPAAIIALQISASCGCSPSAAGRISARWWSASPCSASSLSSVVIFAGKGWFDRHWARCGHCVLCWPDRPARRSARNLVAQTGAVQRHLPGLRSRAEMAAASPISCSTLLPFLAGAFYPRHRLPEERRRPSAASTSPTSPARGCAGLVRAGVAHVLLPPRTTIIVVPLLLWAAGRASCGSWRWATRARHPGRRGRGQRCRRRCTTWLPGVARHPRASPYRSTRASAYARNFPDGKRIYAQRLTVRRPARSTASSYMHFAPGLSRTTRPSACPTSAGERLCRPVHRRRRAVRHHRAQPGAGRDGVLQAICRCTIPYVIKDKPEDLRRAVRRRHLHRRPLSMPVRPRVTVAESNPDDR